MDLSVKNKPGYKVYSESFIAVFIAGNGKEFEEDKNWHDLMMNMANVFEKRPRDVYDLLPPLLEAATNWISISIPDVWCVQSSISNEKFYENPGDNSKAVVHIHLEDFTRKQSTLNFEIKKKPEMKMLQILAAEAIANCVSKKEDIEYLRLPPKRLLNDINTAYDVCALTREEKRTEFQCRNCEKGQRSFPIEAGAEPSIDAIVQDRDLARGREVNGFGPTIYD